MKLRKTLTAFGLMAITATGVIAGPASAFAAAEAPAATPAAEQGDRLIGEFHFSHRDGIYSVLSSPEGKPVLANFDGNADVFSFPAAGTRGEIIDEATGLCLTVDRYDSGKSGRMVTCDGRETQQMLMTSVNGGLTVSVSGNSYRLGVASGPSLVFLPLPEYGPVTVLTDYLAPIGSVEVTTPAAGSTIYDPKPTFSGTGVKDAKIDVLSGDVSIGSTTVDTEGNWSVASDIAFKPGAHAGTVRQANGDKVTAAEWSFTYEAAAADVVLATPTVGSTITDTTPTFSGTGEQGAQISITGDVTAETAVSDDGSWSWTPTTPLALGGFAGTIVQKSGTQTSEVNYSFTLEAEAPARDVELVSPAKEGAIKPGKPVFSGTGQPGAEVKVVTMMQDNVGSTTVKADGSWSITWNKSLAPNHYTGGHVIQSVNGVEQSRAAYDFFVEREFKPLEISTPKVGDDIAPGKPVFSGTGTPGAIVKINTLWGDNVGQATVKPNGSWSITWNKSLAPNRYQGGTVKQFVSNVERDSFTYDFNVVSNPKPFAVTSPAAGGQVPAGKPVFTGTGTPGATIKIITMMQDNVGETTVKADGSWSITWKKSLAPNRYTGGYTHQTIDGKPVGAPVMYDFTVVK